MHASAAEVLVVDASHVGSPEELWEWFAELGRGTSWERVERSVDGLRTALLAGERRRLELHGVERLAERGHGRLVLALEELARAIARQGGEGRLLITRRDPAPMGRLFQHAAFRSRALAGCLLEEVVSWGGRQGTPECDLLWLKPAGRYWQRFFLDVGGVFWEEWGDEDASEDFDALDELLVRLEQPDLRGAQLDEIEAAPFGHQGSGLRISLARGGAIWLLPVDPRDLRSRGALSIVAPAV